MSTAMGTVSKRPWHLWAVAIVSLLWNGSGALTIMLAQAGRLADMDANEAAYYAAQPLWFVVSTDIALLSPLAAAVALLVNSRAAIWLFAVSLIAILGNDAYDLAAGTSLALTDRGWLILAVVIAVIAALQLTYSWAMTKRGVLR
jgi:hypothetical protein